MIVPTIGRPESLSRLLDSLAAQTRRPDEVVVADGSSEDGTRLVVEDPKWSHLGLRVYSIAVQPPNAVRQRQAAIAASTGDALLLLDDDVALEATCLQELLNALSSAPDVVAAMADFNNQAWSGPTKAWRLYLQWFHGMKNGAWNGKVIGPLLRFGFYPVPRLTTQIEWLGTGNSIIKRAAYEKSGGFSAFFLHRCTMNEDVDLGLKLAKVGRILFCPTARLGHFHHPSGRVTPAVAAEDDLYNRYLIMRHTQQRSAPDAFAAVFLFFAIETASNLAGALRRAAGGGAGERLVGRLRALYRIVFKTIQRA